VTIQKFKEMSCLSSHLMLFPNETILKIFRHLDARSLNEAGLVCKRWSDLVQILHDESWRSLTKAVLLKAEIIGPKYKSIGWVEQEHSWKTCNCINIASEFIPYADIERLDHDMGIVESIKYKENGRDIMYISSASVTEAASSLAASRIFTSIDELKIRHFDGDFSSVKNLSHLLRIVKHGVYLISVTIKDLPTLFSHICCKVLEFIFHEDTFTVEDINSLTEVLNDGVEKFNFIYGQNTNFPLIENYDGRGKCHEIQFEYYEGQDDEEFESDLPKIQEWALSRGWTVTVTNDTVTVTNDANFDVIIINSRRD